MLGIGKTTVLKIGFIAILIFQVAVEAVYSQDKTLPFNLVSLPNNKSLGKIQGITQDAHGYIWFAGQDEKCIYRYDGNRIITLRKNDSSSNSLNVNNIECILADDSGRVWVGGQGLDVYNTYTGKFKHYRELENNPDSLDDLVTALCMDSSGILYVGTGSGLCRLDPKTNKIIHYRSIPGDPKTLSNNSVRALYIDHSGQLWVGTGFPFFDPKHPDTAGGLNRLNPDGTFTRYLHDSKNPNSLINNKVRAIFEDSRGVFWVGTAGDGLHTMNRETGSFERHLFDPKNPGGLSRPKQDGGADHITFINEDSAGQIWIGTYLAGLNRFNPATGKTIHYDMSNGFPDSTCWSGFISRDGVLWICTEFSKLLYRCTPTEKSFHAVHAEGLVDHIIKDREGNTWSSTAGNGLFRYDRNMQLVQHYKKDASDTTGFLDDQVGSVYQSTTDQFWVGYFNGIQVFNTVSNRFSQFPDRGQFPDFHTGGLARIIRDQQGLYWFVTYGHGLIRFNQKDSSFVKFVHDPKDPESIADDRLNNIAEDEPGKFWVVGVGGINYLDTKTRKSRHYLPGIFITGLLKSSTGETWAGTESGLYLYNKNKDQFVGFLFQDLEISRDPIGNIVEDNENNLWLSTNNSIVQLNPVTREFMVYGSRFGIADGSLVPWGKSFKDEKGQLYIGYQDGFYIINPIEFPLKKPPKIVVNNFYVNNIQVDRLDGDVLSKPMDETDAIELSYKQNNIGFDFSVLEYREPETIRYYTRLEGYDSVWREALGERSAHYFNITPGDYIFQVKAFTHEGSEIQKSIAIEVNPPWWKSWWAYVVYGLLAMLAGFLIYRMQKKRILNAERQKSQLFELAQAKEIEKAYENLKKAQAQLIQAEKMASLGELTAGIAHEIQNPLNFVNNFSEVNKELLIEMKDEIQKGNYGDAKGIIEDIIGNEEKINHHGKRADAIVKGMLQHSRSNTGQKEATDINKLADDYLRLSYHGFRARDTSFNATMITDFDERVGLVAVVAQDIGRVLLNLFNNAFYSVEKKEKEKGDGFEPVISVSTKKLDQLVEIRIRDNGMGISQKVLDKIYQPFFTTKPPGEGTGLGLSLSYDIVTKVHQGELKVTTVEGEFAEFIIQLPT